MERTVEIRGRIVGFSDRKVVTLRAGNGDNHEVKTPHPHFGRTTRQAMR